MSFPTESTSATNAGSVGPTNSVLTSPTDPLASSASGEPVGFGRVAATITTASGEVCDVCLWLAATPEQRSRGLMGVTDLGDGDGMVFRYAVTNSTSFWMKDTPLPLSIVFFDADGAYMADFDMEPCFIDACPRYDTPREFLDAIEFLQGTLSEFGVGPGSELDVSDLPCG